MITHDLRQGSPEWHAHRAKFWSASDAPAMMGCSPYKTRAQLLHQAATGIAPKPTAHQQLMFNEGHRIEKLALPMAEKLLGQPLYPVSGSLDRFAASFDGLTLGEEIVFEHKSANSVLRDAIRGPDSGALLPLHYRVQLEQQLLVSGAEKTLFMCSAWVDATCTYSAWCWYLPDDALRGEIIAGWAQFEADRLAYAPPDVVAEVVAAPLEHLPAVSAQVRGSLAVVSNLSQLKPRLHAFVERINKSPATDQEFADVGAAGKRLRGLQKDIERAVGGALASIEAVNDLQRLGGELAEVARKAAVACENSFTEGKNLVKQREVRVRADALSAYVAAFNNRYLGQPDLARFGLVIKGLSSLDSVRAKLDAELAEAKLQFAAVDARIRINTVTIESAGIAHQTLFADRAALVTKDPEAVTAIVASRVSVEVEAQRRRIEAERERIRAEEAAKLEAQAAQERRERATQEAARQAQEAAQATAEALRVAAASLPPLAPVAAHAAPAAAPQFIAPATTADEAPTLNLGQMCERLRKDGAAFTATSAFVEAMGIQPTAVVKATKLYTEAQFTAWCLAMQKHFGGVAQAHANRLDEK